MWQNVKFYLKVSRPGLWFQTLWVYMLPVIGTDIFYSGYFWLGFAYILFPLNFLVYGWNDMVDYETDKHNPRKDSYLWGAKGSKKQLKALFFPIIIVQFPFLVIFSFIGGLPLFICMLLIFLVNALYNMPKYGLRAQPPLELVNILGMLLLIPFCTYLNNLSSLPWQSFLYLGIFCILGQIMGEIMDIEPDKKAGRKTTGVVLGNNLSKILVILLVLAEAGILYFMFHAILLSLYMLFATAWLIFDYFYLNKKMPYAHWQFSLLGLAINLAGYGSIIWVWYTQALHHI